jgi:hypothetical protein
MLVISVIGVDETIKPFDTRLYEYSEQTGKTFSHGHNEDLGPVSRAISRVVRLTIANQTSVAHCSSIIYSSRLVIVSMFYYRRAPKAVFSEFKISSISSSSEG